MSGSTPFGRITGIIGVGATPGGQVQTSCCYCYEGARIQVSNVETLCDGIASFDVSFGKTGIDAENLSWSGMIPAIDVGIRITVRWLELLEFQGLSFSVNTTLGDISVYGSGSFDQDLDFGTASWSLRGPFYGGTLSASTTLDLTGILSQSFTWSYRFNGCSISVTPTFDILSFSDAYTMSFDIPSIRVNGNCRLSCCGGADLGTLSWSTTVSKAGFSQISITYTNSF